MQPSLKAIIYEAVYSSNTELNNNTEPPKNGTEKKQNGSFHQT